MPGASSTNICITASLASGNRRRMSTKALRIRSHSSTNLLETLADWAGAATGSAAASASTTFQIDRLLLLGSDSKLRNMPSSNHIFQPRPDEPANAFLQFEQNNRNKT